MKHLIFIFVIATCFLWYFYVFITFRRGKMCEDCRKIFYRQSRGEICDFYLYMRSTTILTDYKIKKDVCLVVCCCWNLFAMQ